MRFFALALATFLALAPVFSFAKEYKLYPDTAYDNPDSSLHNFACSTGEHGLITHGYTKLKEIPTYPNVGGAPQIKSPDSRNCGACYQLTYVDKHHTLRSINYTAIDIPHGHHGSNAFTTSDKSFRFLTDNEVKGPKGVSITVVRKPPSACGLDY